MNKSVDDFFQSGDLNGKLKSALEQDLSSAQLFYEKGLYKLSGSYMQKFINHLNQRDSQQYVSKEAIRKLDADAHALMSSLLQVVN
ncbi:FIMAH domain-containing protein [Fictibacillus sp. NRS-1165]